MKDNIRLTQAFLPVAPTFSKTNSDIVGSRKPKDELSENTVKQRSRILGIVISFQKESLLGVESATKQ